MAVNIWPSANDIAVTAGDGSKLLEQAITKHMKLITDIHFVESGLTLTDGGGLSVDVAAGIAYIDGHYVQQTATTNVAISANVTNQIWAQLTYDGGGNADNATFIVNTSGTPAGEVLLLGKATTDGSSVTSITDQPEAKNLDVFTRKSYVDAATIDRVLDFTSNFFVSVASKGSQSGVATGFSNLTLGDFIWVAPAIAIPGLSFYGSVASATEINLTIYNATGSAFGGTTVSLNYRIFTLA